MKTMNKVALSLAILMSPFFASASDEVADTESLKVTNVEVVDSTTLEVFFSNDIDFDDVSPFDFSLTNTDDEEAEVLGWVDATYTEGSSAQSVLFELSEEMTPNTSYELKVEYVVDVDGNIINEDVNSTYDVLTPDVFPVADEVSAEDSEDDEDTEDEYAEDGNDWLNEDVDEEEVDGDVEDALNAAADEDTEADEDAEVPSLDAGGLPQTGPQEMFLVLVALLVAAGVVYARRRA